MPVACRLALAESGGEGGRDRGGNLGNGEGHGDDDYDIDVFQPCLMRARCGTGLLRG